MYGTIARVRVKPGRADHLRALTAQYDQLGIPGFVAAYLYQAEGDPSELWLAVVFLDRESYRRNAADPAQGQRYREMRELLEADPEWHDGQIIGAAVTGGTAGRGGAGGGF